LSTYENDAQVAEALFEAVQSDKQQQESAPVQPVPPPVPENKPEEPVTGSAQEQPPAEEQPDSFTGLDPNAIPEELQPYYRSMQADYTRSKQNIAEERRAYETLEQFGGVEAAQEAVQFVSALATDPQYALQVHEQLTEALTQAGLTPSQASREAARQINEAVTDTPAESAPTGLDDDYGLGLDPAIERKLAAMEARDAELNRTLEEMKQWREREEENRIQYAMMAEMERQHADVVNEHHFDNDQMSAVYALAYSTGGDLRSAAEIYNGLADQIVTGYLEKKATVTSGAPVSIPATGGGEQPMQFTDLNDPGLEKLVQQRLDFERAQGNL
jgi:hypothetical protein